MSTTTTGAERVADHARRAGHDSLIDYALELEDLLTAIVDAPDNVNAFVDAVLAAQAYVWTWEQQP